MTVIEELTAKKAALTAELASVEAQIGAIPSEFHVLESELGNKIKSWFGSNPSGPNAADVPTPSSPQQP